MSGVNRIILADLQKEGEVSETAIKQAFSKEAILKVRGDGKDDDEKNEPK